MKNLTINNEVRVDIEESGNGILNLVISYNVHDIAIQIYNNELSETLKYIKHSHEIASVQHRLSKRFRMFIELIREKYSNREIKPLATYKDDNSYNTNIISDKEKQINHDEQADRFIARLEDYDS